MNSRTIGIGCAMLLTLQAPFAHAGSAIEACREIADPSERLACYDAEAGRPPEETPEARVERQTRQFGLAERQKAPEERKEVETVSGTIVSVGTSRVTLDNGMVWKITDGGNLLQWLQEGQVATIERGIFSGYRMTVKGVNGKAVVTRLQ